jgi:hypothetical protein
MCGGKGHKASECAEKKVHFAQVEEDGDEDDTPITEAAVFSFMD